MTDKFVYFVQILDVPDGLTTEQMRKAVLSVRLIEEEEEEESSARGGRPGTMRAP